MVPETKIPAYVRDVKYYETDRMGIVHHSNYIRWFEEARIDYFGKVGTPYVKMEEEGFVAPVLSVECNFRSMTRFGDRVAIVLTLTECTGVRFGFSYRVIDCTTGALRASGKSEHCFIDGKGMPINFKKMGKKYFDLFSSLVGVETMFEP